MPQSAGAVEASESVIREIEVQLDNLLLRKRSDIEKALAARIRREQEETRRKLESMEKEFDQEKKNLHEYRILVAEVEAERNGILNDIQELLKRSLGLQSQIEAMARQTVEEIQRMVLLQEKLESLRGKTAEQAGFLKRDLNEKYGIVAVSPGEGETGLPGVDLDQELEKLRRIKELLADKSLRGEAFRPAGSDFGGDSLPGMELDNGWKVRIPDIRELTQSAPPEDESETALPAGDVPAGEYEFGSKEPSASEALELLRKTEPGEGRGDVSYFQLGDRIVLDADRLASTLDAALGEAKKLSLKLDESGSIKEQFFIKQELIHIQESLRAFVLKAVNLCGRLEPVFPRKTRDVFNLDILKEILEKLSIGNWASPEELKSFAGGVRQLRSDLLDRSGAPGDDCRSILDVLEER
jgi:hypothetical protein